MRKLFTLLVAVMMVVGMTTAAMAAFQVEVKSNSEGVTGAASACERAGNLTFVFDAGTIIKDGDFWTADLPLGVTLCKSFDFVVTGNSGTVPGTAAASGFNGTINATTSDDGATLDRGIWAVKDTTAADGVNGSITASSHMFFRITGTSGSNRITIRAYDSDDTAAANGGVAAPANSDGSSTFTVNAGTEFQIKLFDGFNGIFGATTYAYNDSNADGFYGDSAAPADNLQNSNDSDNSYCISIDKNTYSGSTVNVSISSGGKSGNNFLTFNPSNPEVAHIISATAIVLKACKADLYGYVSLAGGQSAVCDYDYNTATNYCADQGSAIFKTKNGNQILIANTSGNFYNAGDQYRVKMTVSGNGAYFENANMTVAAYKSSDVQPCDGGPGTTVSAAANIDTTKYKTESNTAFNTFPKTDCTKPDDGDDLVSVSTKSFTNIDQDNLLAVSVPKIVYVPSMLKAGDQTTVTVTLERLPCGIIFTDSRIVAQYVDTCPQAAPTTSLYYPYAVALDGSQGWWFGMSIGNPSTAAGTATITVYEKDGDIGTYTTPSIAAGGLMVMSAADLLKNLTPNAANTGTLGDTQCQIVVACSFASAGGFAMQGNGIDSTGYTAYGDSNTWRY